MTEQMPVKWDEELARQAKEVATLERPSLSMISLRSGVMKYQDQIVPGNKLECVVVASAFEHRWFKNRFDPDKIQSPSCFALSLTGKDMAPHEASAEKQASICADCEKFEWGSAEGTSRGKACKQVRRLVLIPTAALVSGSIMGAEAAVLNIPVTSTKNWSNYVNLLAAEHNRPPWAVISEVSVFPHPKNQFEVKFKTVNLVSENLLGELYQKANTAAKIAMTPYDYSADTKEEEEDETPKKKRKY